MIIASRKVGEREVAITEDSVDTSIRGIKKYPKKSKERQITVAIENNDNIGRTKNKQKLENWNGKKNSNIDTSRKKKTNLARLHTRKPRQSWEIETLREKLNQQK